MERWNALRPQEIEDGLHGAHALMYEKLPQRTRAVPAMPERERAKTIRARRKMVAARAKAKRK